MTRARKAYNYKKRKRLRKKAKGNYVSGRKLYKTVKERNMRAAAESFKGRKQKKRENHRLQIIRINNSLHLEENKKYRLNFSRFIHLLKLNTEVHLGGNFKSVSEIAINYPERFSELLNYLVESKKTSPIE